MNAKRVDTRPTLNKIAVLAALFALTRVFLFDGALSDTYRNKSGDVQLYESWGSQIVDQNLAPYSGFGIEYPPVIPPAVAIPEVGRDDASPYYERFVKLMLLLDAAAFVCLLFLASRWGSLLGPALWIGCTFLMGSVIYVRLDLIPALVTIAAILFLARGWWGASGGALAFGALAKVYPAFLFPVALVFSPRKRAMLLAGAVTASLILLPHVGALDDLWRNVITYHSDRGIEVGSTWAVVIYVAGRMGYAFSTSFSFGSVNVDSTMSDTLKTLGSLLSLVALIVGLLLTRRATRIDDSAHRAPVAMLGLLAPLMALGTVFSPQFVIWAIALAAAALCHPQTGEVRWTLAAMIPVSYLTQLIFVHAGFEKAPGLLYLGSRNLILLFIGVELWFALGVGRGRPHRGSRKRAQEDHHHVDEG